MLIKSGEYVKRAPIGVYDKTILCEKCEFRFGIWDDYAQNLFIKNFKNAHPVKKDRVIYGYVFDSFDYEKLKLFFISILWRASVSSLDFFNTVNLNDFEDIAKDHIQRSDPGSVDDFSIMLARFDELDGQRSILNPQPTKMLNINFYVFYLTGFVAYIKVDQKRISGAQRKFIVAPEHELPIVKRPFELSQERRLLSRVAKSTK